MKQIPILYSTDMVQAQLDGRKTRTRRQIKKIEIKPNGVGKYNVFHNHGSSFNVEKSDLSDDFVGITSYCPYGKPGDIHWVREVIQLVAWDFEHGEVSIKYATGETLTFDIETDEQITWINRQIEKMHTKGILRGVADDEERLEFADKPVPFIPSIHMPKWCTRIYNRVESIAVEQLQEITEAEALKEGVNLKKIRGDWNHTAVQEFENLWQSINGKDSWEENPFVWVIGYTQISIIGKLDIG